jgi:hypothetical protein
MKKLILSTLLLGSIGMIAQNTRVISSEAYDQLKANHQLEAGVNYTFSSDKGIQASTMKFHPSPAQIDSVGASCSCNIPLDTSFSLVPMQGYTAPYRNDDGSSNVIVLPFNFTMFGNYYNSLYINNNGNVSFGTGYSTFSSTGFPTSNFVMIAPFWADVDTRAAGSGLVYYKMTANSLIVKWDHVGYYSNYDDKLNDFQLIISDGTDSLIPGTNNIAFCYGDMQWTTGDASSGVGGFGGIPTTVGVNNGDGINFSQLTRNDAPGLAYDGPNGLSDGVDWLDNKSFYMDASGPAGMAPLAYDSLCDSLVAVYDSLGNPFRVFFNSMNVNDSIHYTFVNVPVGMFIDPIVMGNTTGLSCRFYPVANGLQTLSINYSNTRFPGIVHNYTRIFDVQSYSSAVGIKNIQNTDNISLYPNPAKNSLSLKFDSNDNYTVRIVDVLGRTVLIASGLSNQSDKIDLGSVNKGVYSVVIESAGRKQVTKKLIVE